MKIQCDYCGNTYEDTLEKCPNCGAPNPSHQNAGKPKTIEELKDWYKKRNLPAPEVTRFFIGVDYKQPKALESIKMRLLEISSFTRTRLTEAVL